MYRIEVHLSKQEDGLWRAEVPALPGCFVDAETADVAIQGIQECAAMALDLYLEAGSPLPEEIGWRLDLPFTFSLPLVLEEHPMKRPSKKKPASSISRDLSGA